MKLLGPFLFLFVFAACDEPSTPEPTRVPEVEEPAPPSDPLESLEPWSDAWVLAHAPSYLDDDEARRAGLEASLTNRDNLYARTRLGAYGLGDTAWDVLPEWNPRTIQINGARAAAFERGETPPLGDDATPIFDGKIPTTWNAWRALGERVFFELPLRSEPFWEIALRDPARGAELGVERLPDGSVPGLVAMRDIDGRSAIGITCALCHTEGGQPGRARHRLDYGAIRVAYYDARGRPLQPEVRARWERWGPGRADVLEDVADTPIAIVDLYGLRHQRRLTQAGTIVHDSPLALAIRQETQYIQANHHHARPPRVLMFALVVYLYSIEPPPAAPRRAERADDESRGRAIFDEQCVGCHDNAVGSSDEIVPIARIGTDPELAIGNARGTGGYRAAPLVRVADAAPYFHHGAVPTLDDLLSPDRFEEDYDRSPIGPGPVPGHRFATSLDRVDRAALVAHLRTL